VRRRAAAAVVLSCLVAIAHVPPSGASPAAGLTRYPYLTDLVGRHVQVNWATIPTVASGSVGFGTVKSGACQTRTAPATATPITVGAVSETQWTASLTKLRRGARYCYVVLGDGASLLGTDPAPTFRPQVATGSTSRFSFAVLGDWGYAGADGTNTDQANLLAQVAASHPRFLITTGDTAYPDGSQRNYGDLQQTGTDTSAVFGPSFWGGVGMSVPLFNTQGNHGLTVDGLVNWPEPKAVASSDGRYSMETYCCTNGTSTANYPSEWYAFDAGPARIYVLDASWNNSNVGTSTIYGNDAANHWTISSDEYLWLQHDLTTHPATVSFAFFHFPLYTDNATETSDPYLQGADGLEGLLGGAGVDLVFNGHAHIYQRNGASAPGMPVSYVTGTGGGTLEPVTLCSAIGLYAIGWDPGAQVGSGCGSAPKPATPDRVYSFLRVTVQGTTVTVTPTDELGRTFDRQVYDFSAPA
jgi:hypothetical protein